jgi:hypothetical protein
MYGIPTAFVLYEILPQERVVTLWSLSILETG